MFTLSTLDPVNIKYISGHCELEDKSLRVLWGYVVEQQKESGEPAQGRICVYDLSLIKNDRSHFDHMQKEYGLPAWDVDRAFFTTI